MSRNLQCRGLLFKIIGEELPSRNFISGGDLSLMKPITCHMDPTSEQVEIHLQVEGHLMRSRPGGVEREKPTTTSPGPSLAT